MRLRPILDLIKNIAQQNNITTPMIVGGIPRDKVLGTVREDGISDLDITTGDKTIHNLAREVSIALNKKFHITSKTMDDGHTSIFFGNLKIDFSSNFLIPNIENILIKQGIDKPSNLQKEMFSRDFTCNSILLDFDLKTIIDPTKMGIDDINKKIIKTCIDPENTFSFNKNRVIRLIYLAAKLDFDIDKNIIDWIENNKNIYKDLDKNYLMKTLNKATLHNPEIAAYWIQKMKLWDVLPMTEELYPFYKNPSLIKKAQFFRNYDYGTGKGNKSGPGTGLFMNLKDYKSVMDFRKKRRNKRKEVIKKIKRPSVK